MQLAELVVRGLFGRLYHRIPFPIPKTAGKRPSLLILHGPNGVGKTTILRMLDGLMRLDFNIFRRIPFASCALRFTNGSSISVTPVGDDEPFPLKVRYDGTGVLLHPMRPGPLRKKDVDQVEKFRQRFFAATDALTLELIETARVVGLLAPRDPDQEQFIYPTPHHADIRLYHSIRATNPKSRIPDQSIDLASRVRRFISEAQANYRRFFATSEPDLFPKIVLQLTKPQTSRPKPQSLLKRLRAIRQKDDEIKRFGLEPDRWDFDRLASVLRRRQSKPGFDYAVTVLSAYVEALESRSSERALVAERLLRFEGVMRRFLINKTIEIDRRRGFQIVDGKRRVLREDQLSSGEYHLLYLMVAALATRRRGSMVAIDEPEMSMHLKWQRHLIDALLEVASNAQPIFIFATHSPDIAAQYRDAMVELRMKG